MPRSIPSSASTLSIVLSAGLIAGIFTLNSVSAAADTPVPLVGAVGTGYEHTCLLTTSGGVMCWGNNPRGQLGNGTHIDSAMPGDVLGLTSGVTALSVGRFHSCALTDAGGAKCWGTNLSGQLGDGSRIDRSTPVDVTGLTSGAAAISAGESHTCAVTTSGGAKCWGPGYLGDGSTSASWVPVDVMGLTTGVAQIAAGDGFTCVVTTSGGAKCWGRNSAGTLGDGTTTTSLTPVDVTGLTSSVAAIAAGEDHACALMTAGGMRCWGANTFGQLGDDTTNASYTPVDVSGLTSGVAAIATGALCAVTTSGGAKCWAGNLGDGTESTSLVPVDVQGLTGVAAMTAGPTHTCAVTTSGGGYCWGNNRYSQLGDGTTTTRLSPVALFAPIVEGIDASVTKIDASGAISLTTKWSGFDPYSKITSYRAQIQTYNGPWADVTLAHPGSTKFTLVLAPDKRYTVQIRAFDKLGRWGAWSLATVIPKTSQETSATYSAGWLAATRPVYWGGSVQRTKRPGSLVMFTFMGHGLEWIGPTGPVYGAADVYMDGDLVATIDCHATAPGQRKVLFRDSSVGTRLHTVEIISRGPRIDIDGFVWFK